MVTTRSGKRKSDKDDGASSSNSRKQRRGNASEQETLNERDSRKEFEEKVRKEFEEKAREFEEKVRKEAEEKAGKEAEEKVRKLEEKVRKEAEEREAEFKVLLEKATKETEELRKQNAKEEPKTPEGKGKAPIDMHPPRCNVLSLHSSADMIAIRNLVYTLHKLAGQNIGTEDKNLKQLQIKANSIRTAARLSLCDLADVSFFLDEGKMVSDNFDNVKDHLKKTHQAGQVEIRFSVDAAYDPPKPCSESELKSNWTVSNKIISKYNDETNRWKLGQTFKRWHTKYHHEDSPAEANDDGSILDEMVAVCLEFIQSKNFLPEEQFRSRLWSLLLEKAICRSDSNLFHGHEYKINSHVYGYKKDHRCDIVEILRLERNSNWHAPLLMVEISAHGKVTDDTYHKDYEKLTSQMQGALFYYITKLGRNAELCRKLIIYGLLINHYQYQLFIMKPMIETNAEGIIKHVTFVVVSPRTWRRSLNLPFSPLESINLVSFGDDLPTDDDGGNVNDSGDIIYDVYSKHTIENEPEKETEEEEYSSVRLEKVDFQTLLPHLLFFVALGRQLCGYAAEMADIMKSMQLSEGFPRYPDNAYTPFSGRKSSNAPAKPPSMTPAQRANKIKTTGVVIGSLSRSVNTPNTVIMRKETQMEEIRILSALQDCQQIVNLLKYSVSNEGFMELVMEELVSWYDYMHGIHILPNNLGIYIGAELLFMRDMSLALQFLLEKGVVHRDISHNNVMFSRLTHQWKLIDFGFARQFDTSSSQRKENYLSFKDEGIYGTRPYIAPEILNGEDYDCRVDWYSLGVLFSERFYCHYPGSVPGDVSFEAKVVANKLSSSKASLRPAPWLFIPQFCRDLYRLHRFLLWGEDKHLRFDLLDFLPGLGPVLADHLLTYEKKLYVDNVEDKENIHVV